MDWWHHRHQVAQNWRHQKGRTHAVSLALWSSGGRVRRVTHTLPMEQRHALRAQFHLIYRVVKRLGMLRGVAGDAEAATLNGVHLIEAYRCHRAVAEILQHIAMHVRIGEAQPVTQALPKDWRRGWKRSPRPWSYGCGASNNDASHQSAANGAAFYFFVVQLVLTSHVPPVPSIEHWKRDQYCPVTGGNFRKSVLTCMRYASVYRLEVFENPWKDARKFWQPDRVPKRNQYR